MADWLSIDFETRSTVDLRKTGVYPYAAHPTTDVWCAAYAFDDGPVEVWRIGEPCPDELAIHVMCGGTLRAWNAQFERVIWNNVMARYGWPVPDLEQWHCTAAQAATMALPRALEQAGKALGLDIEKDMKGHSQMLRMSKPRRYDAAGAPVWWDDEDRVQRLIDYCKQDVRVERAIAERLRPLSATERRVYLLDQKINDRGIAIDIPLVEACLELVEEAKDELNETMSDVTNGAVTAASQVKKLQNWLEGQDVDAATLDKAAVIELLERPELPAVVKEALEIRQEAGKASTAKLNAMARVAPQGRARGLLLYHAASTGRWGGKLIQPQNMPRASVDDVEAAIDAMKTRNLDIVRMCCGSVHQTASALLRPCLVAAPDHRLIAADYSNIEGRVTAWLAGEQWKVKAFRAFDTGHGPDLYKLAYSKSFGVPVDAVSKDQRQVGKVMELALGYQGGVGAFQSMARLYGIDVEDEEADGLKQAWREAHPATRSLWANLDWAALEAVRNPGKVTAVSNGRIKFRVKGGFLWMVLPSGRPLAYARPRIIDALMPWGETREQVEIVGVNATSYGWQRERLYGGRLAENSIQAIARDIMAHAMLALDEAGYRIVLTVHDEIVCEEPTPGGTVEQVERIMCRLPSWAVGCPITAEGWEGRRYRK